MNLFSSHLSVCPLGQTLECTCAFWRPLLHRGFTLVWIWSRKILPSPVSPTSLLAPLYWPGETTILAPSTWDQTYLRIFSSKYWLSSFTSVSRVSDKPWNNLIVPLVASLNKENFCQMAAHSRADVGVGMLLSNNVGTPPEVVNLKTGSPWLHSGVHAIKFM